MVPKIEAERLIARSYHGIGAISSDGLQPIVIQLQNKETRVSWLRKVLISSFVGIAIAIAVLSALWILFRRFKSKSRTINDPNRYDLIDEVNENLADQTDISKATLDELEAALLRVENELSNIEEEH